MYSELWLLVFHKGHNAACKQVFNQYSTQLNIYKDMRLSYFMARYVIAYAEHILSYQ